MGAQVGKVETLQLLIVVLLNKHFADRVIRTVISLDETRRVLLLNHSSTVGDFFGRSESVCYYL